MQCGTESLHQTCRLHQERGRLVESKDSRERLEPKAAGCRGSCPIPGALPYVSLGIGRLCVLPVMHILLLGLAKSFWTLVLRGVKRGELRPNFVLPNAMKAELKRRGTELRLTADFGRPYM